MRVRVQFFSYLRELAGCPHISMELPDGHRIADLLERLYTLHPPLASLHASTLIAVGVEYQGRSYVLHDGDEVSLFPPVSGG